MNANQLRFVVVASLAGAVHAQGTDAGRVQVGDVRTLMVAAIDSRDGTARGILTGTDAESITKLFRATGPLLVDVTTVKRYAEASCSRLRVAFAQEGVHTSEKAPPSRNWVAFGINYCRDGKPPKSLS